MEQIRTSSESTDRARAINRRELARLRDKAQRLDCSVELVRYIERLESTIDALIEFHTAVHSGEAVPFPVYPPKRSR